MKKILLIEDNPDNPEIVATTLKKSGYGVIASSSGEEALKKISQKPALVFLDLSLPRMSGWEVIRLIRAQEAYKDLPVIALTAHAMVGDREKVLASGCSDYLAKPCLPKDIIQKTKKWIGESDVQNSGSG